MQIACDRCVSSTVNEYGERVLGIREHQRFIHKFDACKCECHAGETVIVPCFFCDWTSTPIALVRVKGRMQYEGANCPGCKEWNPGWSWVINTDTVEPDLAIDGKDNCLNCGELTWWSSQICEHCGVTAKELSELYRELGDPMKEVSND